VDWWCLLSLYDAKKSGVMNRREILCLRALSVETMRHVHVFAAIGALNVPILGSAALMPGKRSRKCIAKAPQKAKN